MYKNLVETAHEEGFKAVVVEALACKEDGQVLLLEDLQGSDRFYHFPYAELKEGETLPQAIQRALIMTAALHIKEVRRFLGHYDREGRRYLNFVVEVSDPYAVEENKGISFAWLDIQEAVGYPIHDETRGMLDLFAKTQLG